MTAPLPLPDDPRLAKLTENWPRYEALGHTSLFRCPRSAWLHDFEDVLLEHYPDASAWRLALTARLAAPFPLAKPGVP